MIRKSIILTTTVALLALSPTGLAFAQGGGGGGGAGAGSAGGGTGAAGMGSAAVGGGAPAGSVGGPPAGVGGGAPGSNDPAGNHAAGTDYMNAARQRVLPPSNPAAGLENAPTAGGVIGGNTGVPAGGTNPSSPPITGQTQADPASPRRPEYVAEQPPSSRVGRAVFGPDGVSTKIVAPRPCGVAAHETDGTTTCVGIPARR
jgi:hypothetical protein